MAAETLQCVPPLTHDLKRKGRSDSSFEEVSGTVCISPFFIVRAPSFLKGAGNVGSDSKVRA